MSDHKLEVIEPPGEVRLLDTWLTYWDCNKCDDSASTLTAWAHNADPQVDETGTLIIFSKAEGSKGKVMAMYADGMWRACRRLQVRVLAGGEEITELEDGGASA